MNIYICSDIHGDYRGLMNILEKINFSNKDQLIINGDLIDRGYESAQLIEFVLDNENVELLLGNHEILFLKGVELFPEIYIGKAHSSRAKDFEETYLHYMNGGKATMDSLRRYYKYNINERDLTNEFYKYLKNAKLSKVINEIRISHTGIYDEENIYDSVWDRNYWQHIINGKREIVGKNIIGHSSIGSSYNNSLIETGVLGFLLENKKEEFVINIDGSDLNIIPIYDIDNHKLYFQSTSDKNNYSEVNLKNKKVKRISV
ncbi:metallophosphoesterase [Cetobacterium sp.]|uniref:metallophosphoesterase n=1 Tax=Cetobacterium sp. TaxID=2071632 RepID=UPI003F2B3F03